MPASIKHLTDKKLNLTSLLARWKDGLYYTAAIVKCDKINKKCLVCFEDGSEVWVNNRDVHLQLSLDQLSEDEDIVCCICDDGNSEPPNEIILCDVCQQGYHQRCHSPPVDSSTIDESDDTNEHKDWFCVTCSYILHQSNREKLSADAQKHQQQSKQKQAPSSSSSSSSVQPPTPKQTESKCQLKQAQQQQRPQQQSSQPKPKPQQQQPATTQAPQQTQSKLQQTPQHEVTTETKQQTTVKTVKSSSSTPISLQVQQKTTVGPIKQSAVNHVQKQVAAAPYYPLSNQVRVAATSSTAALVSLTASSALTVGSSAGRTKQDLVNQSNRSTQRQQQRQPGNNVDVVVQQQPPVKHAVRKSSVNFVMPVRQSALPTATRSVLPNMPTAKAPSPSSSTYSSSPSSSSSSHPTVAPTYTLMVPSQQQATTSIVRSNTNNKNVVESRIKLLSGPQATSVVSSNSNKLANWTPDSSHVTSSTSSMPRVDTSAPAATTTGVAGGKSVDSVAVSTSLASMAHPGFASFANNGGSKITKIITIAESNNTSSMKSSQNDVSNANETGSSTTVTVATTPATVNAAQPHVTVNADSAGENTNTHKHIDAHQRKA